MKRYYLIKKKNPETEEFEPYEWGELVNEYDPIDSLFQLTFQSAGHYQASYIEGWVVSDIVSQNKEIPYVDLGLPSRLLWATYDIGSSQSGECGNLLAWADADQVSSGGITQNDYHTNIDPYGPKYGDQYEAPLDISENTLFDVAAKSIGNGWRMPNVNDFIELKTNCTWEIINVGERKCIKGTGPNGNTIIFPACGVRQSNGSIDEDNRFGLYWTSQSSTNLDATHLLFQGAEQQNIKIQSARRFLGMLVRPVKGESGSKPIPEALRYVDLGLPSKTLWANMNVGATEVYASGKYYAWGEIQEKENYSISTYMYISVENGYEKIGRPGTAADADTYQIGGDAAYDPAIFEFGEDWNTPSKSQFDELIEQCDWTWQDGSEDNDFIPGYIVKSKTNNNSIYLPAVNYWNGTNKGSFGKGRYWTGSFYLPDNQKRFAWAIAFGKEMDVIIEPYKFYDNRFYGMPIRPIYVGESSSYYDGQPVDLGLTSGNKWASWNIGATKASESGDRYAWGELETKGTYTSTNYFDTGYTIHTNIKGTEYDVAKEEWGGKWRMPDEIDFLELFEECNLTWGTNDDVEGLVVTSKLNGNSIFFPIYPGSDVGDYWSSTIDSRSGTFQYKRAWTMHIQDNLLPEHLDPSSRYLGLMVRPIWTGEWTPPTPPGPDTGDTTEFITDYSWYWIEYNERSDDGREPDVVYTIDELGSLTYASPNPIGFDPTKTVKLVYYYNVDTVYATGHFESVDGQGDHRIKLVFDTQIPSDLRTGTYYSYVFEEATFGDENFKKYLTGDRTIKKNMCHVNPSPAQATLKYTTQEDHFAMYPLFVDSTNGILYHDFNTSGYYLTGNQTFFAKTDTNKHLNDVVITNNYANELVPYPVDNYGFLFSKNTSYGHWEGGVGEASYDITLVMSCCGVDITVHNRAKIDEDNHILMDGCYLNKLYKVSHSGGELRVNADLYPSSFSDYFYDDDFKPKLYNVIFDGANTAYTPVNEVKFQHIYSSMQENYESLTYTIDFNIPRNTSNSWKDECFAIYADVDEISNGSEVCLFRILQEPVSNKRIYYGKPHSKMYMEDYGEDDSPAVTKNLKYLFNTLGSHVLTENEFEFTSLDVNWELLVPSDIENTYTITNNGQQLSVDTEKNDQTETWGDVVYNWITIRSKNSTIKFVKK